MKAFSKTILPVLGLLLSFSWPALSQETDSLSAAVQTIPEGYELADSVVLVPAERVDTSLVGENIFDLMPSKSGGDVSDVNIYQSSSIVSAMKKTLENNVFRPYTGYRVRIFFDNRQTARHESEEMLSSFEAMYPGVPAYRSYVNPYFKITVGDFRTKSEAMQLLEEIKREFPAAFIVKENINYPVVDKDNAVRADTLHVLRPLPEGAVTL